MSARAGIVSAPFLSVNGVRVAEDTPHVSARDRGFTLADGLFETLRVAGGRAFQLPEHLARLDTGLAALRIPPVPELVGWAGRAVKDAGLSDAALRITVTRGSGGPSTGARGSRPGLAPPLSGPPTVIVSVTPLPEFGPDIYAGGLSAQVVSGRRNDKGRLAGVKTLSYTENVVALLEAQEGGADEALLLDTDDHLSEASASNLFLLVRGTLVTPPVTCGALPGITRATVLALAARVGLPAAERVCGMDDLWQASEAFLTSSLRGLAPLVRVNGREIANGAPGATTRELMSMHAQLLEPAA